MHIYVCIQQVTKNTRRRTDQPTVRPVRPLVLGRTLLPTAHLQGQPTRRDQRRCMYSIINYCMFMYGSSPDSSISADEAEDLVGVTADGGRRGLGLAPGPRRHLAVPAAALGRLSPVAAVATAFFLVTVRIHALIYKWEQMNCCCFVC